MLKICYNKVNKDINMLIKVSEIKLDKHVVTIYRKISLYRIPFIYIKMRAEARKATLYIDEKYLKYLHNEPKMKFLTKFAKNWICENIKDIELRQFILKEMKTMDKYELIKFYINKNENNKYSK